LDHSWLVDGSRRSTMASPFVAIHETSLNHGSPPPCCESGGKKETDVCHGTSPWHVWFRSESERNRFFWISAECLVHVEFEALIWTAEEWAWSRICLLGTEWSLHCKAFEHCSLWIIASDESPLAEKLM
jgi:hypothetical protein